VCKKEGMSLCDSCLHRRARAFTSPSPYIISIYSFKDPIIKKIIHSIKYFHKKDLAPPITKEISNLLVDAPADSILIPIPIPSFRKYIRGHNHTETLADEISKQTGFPVVTDILLRTKNHKRQVKTKSRKERLMNQRNAFHLGKDAHNKTIILIDDVTTTGATLLEARTLLLNNGARSVKAYTIAH
jgi:competence protein ComFC